MSAFDSTAARDISWRVVENEGLRSNQELPLLDSNLKVRQSLEAVGTRLLCMHAAASHAFGLPLDAARTWVDQEGLRDGLSRPEWEFLSGKGRTYQLAMQLQVHSVYTLAWCASLVGDFSVCSQIPDDLVGRLPDLRKSESSSLFRASLALRPSEEMFAQLDVAYCFHWAWRDARLSLKHMRVNHESLAAQRRKALEWMMRGGPWDEVPLDT